MYPALNNKMIFVYYPHPTIDAYTYYIYKQIAMAERSIRKENPHKTNHNQIYIKKKLLLLFSYITSKKRWEVTINVVRVFHLLSVTYKCN